MDNGYWQKLLRVNLSTRQIKIEDIAEDDLKKYIGGAGLAGKIIYDELPPKLNPYDPRNLLIFATGPFQGPSIPGGAKFSIAAISPLTGTFADSAAGASWGPSLKDAGYDVLIVEGASAQPVYLTISDGQVTINDAAELWGMDTSDTVDEVHARMQDKKYSVACIGPAGENRVAVGCIVIDKHSFAGRCGLGAVMGSKNLKAIAVKGTRRAGIFDNEATVKAVKTARTTILESLKKSQWQLRGTTASPAGCETIGDLPVKYWSGDVWKEGAKKISHPIYTELLKAKPLACKYCPVGCHRAVSFSGPEEYAVEGAGPEYETLAMMGSNLLIDDPKVIAKANDMANRFGMDTISTGAMVGFAMECYDRGWLTTEDTNGIELKWGEPEVLITLVEQIARKTGFGAIFADGTLKAAEKINPEAPDIVAHCKGLDFPGHDPRSCISLAPSYATSTRGACHYRGPCEDVEMGWSIPELGITEDSVDFFERRNQSEMAAKCQDYASLINSLVCCTFMVTCVGETFNEVRDIFNGITGWDYTIEDLMLAGERAFTVQRLINIRDGYDARTDVMPKKMFKAAQEGFRAGKILPFNELMKDYYEWRGWNNKGLPSHETLARLDLNYGP
jgi:aldehyde:ferredoxin oxidoreductase